MLFYGVLVGLLATVSGQYCYQSTSDICSSNPVKNPVECNAKFGNIDDLLSDLQSYAMASIDKSYEFLLMSSHFGNYETNREGFKKLYRKLSDKAWENAIDMIKYITQRGGSMNFMEPPRLSNLDDLDNNSDGKVFELIELNSLAKALDNEKKLVNKALYIYKEAQHQVNKIDGAVAHYVEEHLIEPLSESVRQLAGYTNDLKNMLTVHEHNDARGVAVFLFDEYLSKSL